MTEKGPPQGRVLRSQSLTSASGLPGSPSRTSVFPRVASARYVKQFHAFIEHQRQTFDQERALWNIERMELHEKITRLEEILSRYHAKPSSQVSSPTRKSNTAPQSNNSFQSFLSTDGSSHTSTSTTGHEIWRGSKPDVQPTRTFSDPTIQTAKPGDRSRLPSIAEDTTCGRKDPSDIQPGLRKSSVPGAEIDKNLDGINFKSKTLSPVPIKNIMTPQSPSPRTSSPSRLSPKTIQLPSFDLEAPLDLYTKDAGHTPLARRTYINADGPSSDGNGATPTQPETDRPPLEPHVSFARLPSERSDSYFPEVEDEAWDEKDNSVDEKQKPRDGEDKSRDEDLELKGPLMLDSSEGENNSFYRGLFSKLTQVADELEASGSPDVGSNEETSPDKVEEDFEQPEHEPKLRIKRSMNFGSAFGAKTCGKGI